MSRSTYSWTKAPVKGTDAQEVGQWIADLPIRTTDAILKAAGKSASPLHPLLEWDESRAAYKHRCYQVNQILARLTVGTGKTRRPAFMMTHRAVGFVPSTQVTQEEVAEWVADCARKMANFERRFTGLGIAREVIKAMGVAQVRAKRLLNTTKKSAKAG